MFLRNVLPNFVSHARRPLRKTCKIRREFHVEPRSSVLDMRLNRKRGILFEGEISSRSDSVRFWQARIWCVIYETLGDERTDGLSP